MIKSDLYAHIYRSILKLLLQAKLNSAKLDLATHFIVVMVDVTEGSLKVFS